MSYFKNRLAGGFYFVDTSLESLDFFLDALFLGIIPAFEALSIALYATPSFPCASFSLSEVAKSDTSFIAPFIARLRRRLKTCFLPDTLSALRACLVTAIVRPTVTKKPIRRKPFSRGIIVA